MPILSGLGFGYMCLAQSREFFYVIFIVIFWMLVTSLLAGFISLFGIAKLGAKKILWKALIGIVLGLVVEFFLLKTLIIIGLGTTA